MNRQEVGEALATVLCVAANPAGLTLLGVTVHDQITTDHPGPSALADLSLTPPAPDGV
ncbi:hypothetical protein [Streptomyces sp. ICBB 8177]|uniref:hypothetical protein n=1 Tax=Streptomyces sp. ICBB 8177 TaxID=563922 RepID=UPI0013051D06|nr:hypothetical protein [Streptomyces sp. ICBB 8177]